MPATAIVSRSSQEPSAQFTAMRAQLSSPNQFEANDALHQIIRATKGADAPYAFRALLEFINDPESVIRFSAEIPAHRESTAHFINSMTERAASTLFLSPNEADRSCSLRFHANHQANAANTSPYARDKIIYELEKTQDRAAAKSGIEFLRRYTSIIRDEEQYDGSTSSAFGTLADLRNMPATHEAILAGKTAALVQGLRNDSPDVQASFLLYADVHKVLFSAQEWSEVRALAHRMKDSSDKSVSREANTLLEHEQRQVD